jgi:putative oxidoreductase
MKLSMSWLRTLGGICMSAHHSALTGSAPGVEAQVSAGGDWLLLLGRVLLSSIFVLSGYGKLMGLAAFAASLEKNGVPFASTLAPVGACVEFFGGLAILLGIEIRYAALLMVAFVIVATLISHRFWELQDAARQAQMSNFMKNVAIMGGFVVLHVAGGGRYALERIWRRA